MEQDLEDDSAQEAEGMKREQRQNKNHKQVICQEL